jgi:predicted nucleotidyltransferase
VTLELAREVAASVGALDGVTAVALGGSLARGRGDPHSDVDLGIYYDPARPFAVEDLRALVTELDDRHGPELVGFGEWGPWINGGAWTRMRGTKLDLLYRDLGLVDRVLDDCAAGRVTCDYQPGHPHGFSNHIYAGEVHHGLALHDPDGALAERKARTSPYPDRRSSAATCGRPTSPSGRPPGRPAAATWPMSAAACSGPSPAWSRCCSPSTATGS